MQRALLLGLILFAAGCIGAPGTSDPADPGASVALPFPDPMAADHDHQDVTIHGASYRFEETWHHALAGSATHSSGAHALDARAGYLFAAVYGGEADAEGGFFVFDIADPLHPVEVGRFRFPGALGGDRSLEATEDGNWVVLGTEPVDCAGHVNPVAPGLHLIDVRDKTDPKPAFYLPNTGVHSVTVHRIAGEDYVFALMPQQNIVHIVKEPVPRLEPVGQVSIAHDSMVMDDPALGVPLLYAANGGAGFVISDVSDPANPKQLAEWNIPDRGDRYYIHTGAVQTIGGRRIAVVTSEDWEDYPSALWVLDATDLGLVQMLANWSAPGEHAADGLRYSMHNPRFLGDDLILAYYHGGAWSLDLSTPSAPKVQGLFVPGETNGWKPQPTETHAVS
ncbi:MAG TPA: hypothetical protein VM370_06990, partial [Candidatus Thermoplasmatota archaeon]|nr:hypothetical protein [Candidatus Thermoplasmatota archaeon]